MSPLTTKSNLQLDALSTERALRRRLADFAQSQAYLRAPALSEACHRLWESDEATGGLVGQLWVEGIFASRTSGNTLRSLSADGIVTRSLLEQLDRTGAFPVDRSLYLHQERAIRLEAESADGNRPAVVITAPTGAGKTEAFLLPMLNGLFRHSRRPGQQGVRAIILYPMNALVNDQVDRLYEWLKQQQDVTVFHFTGETPEDDARARAEGYPSFERCRLRTREQARSHVPDVLITNYSMLEYMLCRPQDAVFFGSALQTIVVDEAHLYDGTLAAEISLLLRRVLLRCRLSPAQVFHIATSATLGGEVASFASKLFGKAADSVLWLEGESTRTVLADPEPPETPCRPESLSFEDLDGTAFFDGNSLIEDPELADATRRRIAPLVGRRAIEATAGCNVPAKILHDALRHSPVIARLEDALWQSRVNGILQLNALAAEIWGSGGEHAVKATARILQLASRARTRASDLPLVPHKLHLMARAPTTVSACVNPKCTTTSNRLPGAGRIVTDAVEQCPDCGKATLTLCRCERCGEALLAGILQDDNTLNLRPRWRSAQAGEERYWYARLGTQDETPFDLTNRLCEDSADNVFLERVDACPNCGADSDAFAPVGFGDGLALPLVAETLVTAMPPVPGPKADWLPARGRRLLVFSDSRREAARLGPVLTRQHEVQLGRALVNSLLIKHSSDQRAIEYLRRDIARLEDELRTGGPSEYLEEELRDKSTRLSMASQGLSISRWRDRVAASPQIAEFFDRENGANQRAQEWSQTTWERNAEQVRRNSRRLLSIEMASPSWRNRSLETLGLAEIVYPGIESLRPDRRLLGTFPNAKSRGVIESEWPLFLASLLDTIRMDGAVTLGSEEADYNEHYFPLGSWVSRDVRFRSNLLPMIGRTERSRRNAFCKAFLEACGIERAETDRLFETTLDAAFQALLSLAGSAGCPWIETSMRETPSGSSPAIRLVFEQLYLRRPVTPYRCTFTGEIWPRSVAGKSANANGQSHLVSVSHEQLDDDARVGRTRRELLTDVAFQVGIWAEEHSAQLESKENRRLQDLFGLGARNILSATTTLEVGIDIGGLSGVMLGNVPPGRANYQQRGGRAGRRSDGSSIVVTYTRNSSYDLAVFRDFSAFFHRPLRRPTVMLGRERFGRRHLHSFLIGEFFRLLYAPETHVGAMQAFNSIGWLCGQPMIPVARSGEPRPERVIEPQYGFLQTAFEWWRPGEHIAEQFEGFLHWHGEQASELTAAIKSLLRETPLSASETSVLLADARETFRQAWTSWQEEHQRLVRAWLDVREGGRLNVLNAIAHQANAMWRKTVIEELATRRFLPRYGFPIGLQSLTSPNFHRDASEPVSLERDGILAVSEYVPGSTVLAGGKTYTSQGLVSFWGNTTGEREFGVRLWHYKCLSGHVWYRTWPENGPHCGVPECTSVKEDAGKILLVPKYGYSTAASQPPSWSGNPERVGRTQLFSTAFLTPNPEQTHTVIGFGRVSGLKAVLCEGGELLASNSGEKKFGFAICTRCGYAESETKIGTGREKLPSSFELHIPLSQLRGRCWKSSEAPVLRNHHLAALQVTDLVELDFTGLSHPLLGESTIKTLGYALKLAGAELLELDAREIGVTACRIGRSSSWGLQIFDSAAGGAGHAAELFSNGGDWLTRAREVMFRDKEHDQRCVTGCLRCLLISASQADYEAGLLRRRAAIALFDDLRCASDTGRHTL